MKENKYDDTRFFDQYSRFPRSVQGLSAAGEWHELQQMLPVFEGKRVLDLGCGFGWHCIYAAQQGAASVVGVDLSEKMLAEARRKTQHPNVTYVRQSIEDFAYPKEAFDVVISSLAFHYVASFDAVCERVGQSLAPGGDFVFSVEHPVFTAQGKQDWAYSSAGDILHWPVDGYFLEGERNAVFLGENITKYHRTMTSYFQGLLKHGFRVMELCEPTPSGDMLKSVPGMQDELRRPMMLIIATKKV